jgi:hypothetical protein
VDEDQPDLEHRISDDRAEVARQRAALARKRLGYEWVSLIIALPEPPLAVVGIKSTPATRQLFKRYREDHYYESGWSFIQQDNGPEAWFSIEFYSPVPCAFSICFALKDAATLQIIQQAHGKLALAISKDSYKRGEMIGIITEDDIPSLMVMLAKQDGPS